MNSQYVVISAIVSVHLQHSFFP